MAKISGHGGTVIRDDTADVTIHNSQYEVDVEAVIDDVTTSGSAGFAEGLPIIRKVNSVTIEAPDDDAPGGNSNLVTALGMTEGSVVTLFFKRGAAANHDKVENTVVRSVRVTNPQQGARRVVITTEYGTFSRGVASPS